MKFQDWQSAAVALALIIGDIALHMMGKEAQVLDTAIPVIVGAYVGGRVASVTVMNALGANNPPTPPTPPAQKEAR